MSMKKKIYRAQNNIREFPPSFFFINLHNLEKKNLSWQRNSFNNQLSSLQLPPRSPPPVEAWTHLFGTLITKIKFFFQAIIKIKLPWRNLKNYIYCMCVCVNNHLENRYLTRCLHYLCCVNMAHIGQKFLHLPPSRGASQVSWAEFSCVQTQFICLQVRIKFNKFRIESNSSWTWEAWVLFINIFLFNKL